MGDVYKAEDTRLGRHVALKFLSARVASPQQLKRFAEEARATAALNHPNVVGIHDIGEHDGTPFIVSEFIEGQTLRLRIARGPLPLAVVRQYVSQIADGLSAAHDARIVHRDLKPENVIIGVDGRVRIIDFGIAKSALTDPEDLDTAGIATPAGVIVGTPAYMSPDQVRGARVDRLTDIFSFGIIIHEMVCGAPPFGRDVSDGVLHAILSEDPPRWPASLDGATRALEPVVRRCLEKQPTDRFQSARDIKYAIEAVYASAAAIGLVDPVGAPADTPGAKRTTQPQLQRLTFGRGTIYSARFAPDGQTVVYSAAWNGEAIQLYVTRPEHPESRSFGPPDLRDAELLAISPRGDVLVSLQRTVIWLLRNGLLARMPFLGDAPRQLIAGVQDADWIAPSDGIAVVRRETDVSVLEFPLGVCAARAPLITSLRVSRDGSRVAFVRHQSKLDDAGDICVVEGGEVRTLAGDWSSALGLAWSPSDTEVWFTASSSRSERALHAVTLNGSVRTLASFPVQLTLLDVWRDGRVLLSTERLAPSIVAETARMTKPVSLSYLDYSVPRSLSADGATLLFDESGEGGGERYSVYVRSLKGGAPVRLGDGLGIALSENGQWALIGPRSRTPPLFLVPTGPGAPVPLKAGPIRQYISAQWIPGTDRLVVCGAADGARFRLYAQDIEGEPSPISEEGIVGPAAVSPDGREALGLDPARRVVRCATDGSGTHVIDGLGTGYIPIQWSQDGRSVYVKPRAGAGTLPIGIMRYDLDQGTMTLARKLTVTDPVGVRTIDSALMTRDGRTFVFDYVRRLSVLYLLTGVS